jgi:3-hydroxyisobutyrate dehydrogenase-like beta-hydroxyacid dehydrogenase
MNVAFLGVGTMGSLMAANLADVGHRLAVYNRTTAKAEEFASVHDAAHATSPAEAVSQADVIITMVSDGSAANEVYDGEAGVLVGLQPGALCIDMSTIAPSDVHVLATKAASRGAAFVDAPVSGSVAMAEAGTLTIMAGGAAPDVERARPLFEAMGSKLYHVGPLGSGATVKLSIQVIIYGLNEALSEGLVLAERAGITREMAYEVFANSAIAAPFVHYRREAFEQPGSVPVAFRLVLEQKDLRLALDLAESLGVHLEQTRVNLEVTQAAIAAGYGDHDVSAVAEYLRHCSEEAK